MPILLILAIFLTSACCPCYLSKKQEDAICLKFTQDFLKKKNELNVMVNLSNEREDIEEKQEQ